MSWSGLRTLVTGVCLAAKGANHLLQYRSHRGIRDLVGSAFWPLGGLLWLD